MQLQTIVTLTYYYYITSYFYILLLRSRLLSENSAPIFEFSSFIHTYFLHCCSSYYYPTPHVLLYSHIAVLQKKTQIQSQKTCFLIDLIEIDQLNFNLEFGHFLSQNRVDQSVINIILLPSKSNP